MPSKELAFVNEMLRANTLAGLTLVEQRAALEAAAAALPPSTEVTAIDAGGVPCEWIRTPSSDPARIIVSLRGGGYCLGSLETNRSFCRLLADHGRATVLNVGYRNAPEHRHPAALEDALTVYRWLLATAHDPATIAFAGNSAGGGLVLACLLALRDAGDPLPACATAVSPWTDLAATGESIVSNAATEVMLDPEHTTETSRLYAHPSAFTDPYASPLYGDPAGLPPLLLQASDAEILRDDSIRFAHKASRAGVDVTLELAEGVPHVWHLFAGLLPEADQAWERFEAWLERRLRPAASQPV